MKVPVRKISGIFFIVIIITLAFIYVYNKHQLWQEARKYPPIGEMVDINGHKMHIYSEGEGKETLVFLAGWSTSSPVWDFKALYSQLSDRYRIVVVERSGYGYSETSGSPRDIDTVLEESRFVLKQTGETEPYILVPHSVSGLEAIYWAQKYPNEVRAIIGLDISVPETYDGIEQDLIAGSMKDLERDSFIKNFGVIRFTPNFFDEHEPIMFNYLTEAEKRIYKSVVYRSYYTKDMINEGYEVLSNAKKVSSLDIPAQTPTFLFIATEQGEGHINLSIQYLSKVEKGNYIVLEGGHYIHDFQPEEIARKSIEFIGSLTQ